ncbi:hypothetical protein CK203_024954 [Vitis vinifera]|uniref:Reverse transcriptase zinc-binding domain-containing protein n=1 Tax=Vitis vinifera TaxID=29760 RepID=A0A438J744_VITVI|nr:hypothetical protein CK203_024954 [Vitis vinifera]
MGDARRVRFWEDRWCGDDALSLSSPSLFALVASKEAWVVEVWDPSGEEGSWNPCLSRPFNDWEMEIVERFLSPYKGRSAMEGSSTVPFPNSIIWSAHAPTKLKRSFLGGIACLWARNEERFGKQPPCIYFGQFGRKEIGLLLKMRSFLSEG